MEFTDLKVLIVGMAKSGVSAALLCSSLGAIVTVYDAKAREELGTSLDELEEKGIHFWVGKDPAEIVTQYNLIVMSPGVPTDLSFIHKARESGIPIWGEVELAYHFCACPIIAITGTNGKTTTTALTGDIIQTFHKTHVVGNIGIPFTEKVQQIEQGDWVVAEVSSFQLETIHTFHPRIGAVLNITPDHLNRHKTYENYIEAKERIFLNQTEEDFCILNYDDPICKKMSQKTKAKVIYFSRTHMIEEGVYVKDQEIYAKWKGKEALICKIDSLQILGNHNVENAMAAAAISLCAGVPLKNIQKALTVFKGVEHRNEYVDTIQGVDYYNDSKATNPAAAILAIQAMQKPIVLIGGGMDKGNDFTEWIEVFPNKVKHLIVIGETADKIILIAKQQQFYSVEKVESLEQAVQRAAQIAKGGECVLLSPACASWDMFTSYEERGRLFKHLVHCLKE